MSEIVIVILAGLLAAPKVFSGRSKTADEFIKTKIAPWQGYMGILLMVWGIWNIIDLLRELEILKEFPILWVTFFAFCILELCLGALLGGNLVIEHMKKKSPQAASKAELVYKKLAPWQTALGVIGVGMGVWGLIAFYALS